jgi:hypothetical protein
MEIINLTPHSVTVAGQTFAPSGTVARVASESSQIGSVNGIPLYATTYGLPTGTGLPTPGVYYIVSRMVAEAAKAAGWDTGNMVVPYGLIRDDQGRVVAAQGLEVVM